MKIADGDFSLELSVKSRANESVPESFFYIYYNGCIIFITAVNLVLAVLLLAFLREQYSG